MVWQATPTRSHDDRSEWEVAHNLAVGKVLQFDQARGYGFVAAEDGGDDIFLHASVFNGDPLEIVPGMRVEFQVMVGDRGRKAFAAHSAADESYFEIPHHQAANISSSVETAEEEEMCDVLSPEELSQELTEILLSGAPELTGGQILQARRDVLEFARKRGWIDA
jgi:cold shock protein